MLSFILIRATVWPQYINVIDRQTGQTADRYSDSIGRTVLQAVAQKPLAVVGDESSRLTAQLGGKTAGQATLQLQLRQVTNPPTLSLRHSSAVDLSNHGRVFGY